MKTIAKKNTKKETFNTYYMFDKWMDIFDFLSDDIIPLLEDEPEMKKTIWSFCLFLKENFYYNEEYPDNYEIILFTCDELSDFFKTKGYLIKYSKKTVLASDEILRLKENAIKYVSFLKNLD